MSDSEDHIDIPDDDGDDLFGGDDGDDVLSQASEPAGRVLSDHDLASEQGDDQGDDNRMQDDDDEDQEPPRVRQINIEKVALYRHRIPKSKEDQLTSMRVPNFLKFDPIEYKADSFEPTKWDTDNANSATPIPVIRYRRDPATGKMQSNANIYRWSDGSVTMAVGDEHFQIQKKELAPPPKKAYNELKDAHYYAAAANLSSNTLLVVGHLTEQYRVEPNRDVNDPALLKLEQQMKQANEEKNTEIMGMITEDPELQKKQAELAEKERNRAQRKREAAAARMDGAGNRTHRGALSIGDLEGGRRGATGGRKRGAGGQPKKQRRNNEYDSDDDLPGGVGRHDDYVEDDFVVGSDEEEEGGDDDEEEEILDDDEEEEEEAPKRKRQRTADAEDEDAEGEDDEDAPTQSKHRRARRVVDDEEDDE